jgi:hypothetical protein
MTIEVQEQPHPHSPQQHVYLHKFLDVLPPDSPEVRSHRSLCPSMQEESENTTTATDNEKLEAHKVTFDLPPPQKVDIVIKDNMNDVSEIEEDKDHGTAEQPDNKAKLQDTIFASPFALASSETTIKLGLHHNKGLFSHDRTIRITNHEGDPYVDGIYIKEHRDKKTSFTMYNKYKVPMAVCEQHQGHQSFNVMGTSPLGSNTSLTKKVDGHDFYSWLQVRYVDAAMKMYPILAWNGSEYEACIKVVVDADKTASSLKAGLTFAIMNWDCEYNLAKFSKKRVKGLKRMLEEGWEVEVYPGIDPGLVLCLAVCLENLIKNNKSV